MPLKYLPALALAAALLPLARPLAAEESPASIGPGEWLKAQPKPHFRSGHTLPPLTRFGWTLPIDARIELAEHWGYCLEFGGYATHKAVDKAFDDPESPGGRVLALAAADPEKYRLGVILSRELPKDPPPETWARDAEGNFLGGKRKIWSPEAPQSVLDEAAALRAGPLRRLRERAPVAVLLNGGEYALGVLGFCQKYWEQDPRIVKAKGDRPWFDYISEKKALMETTIAEAVRKAVPDRTLYIYYTSGGGTHRNRTRDWDRWAYGFRWMRAATDLPSNEHYYRHFNDGWTGRYDMLTMSLGARGYELKLGHPHCYDWLCAGWTRPEKKPQAGANPAALVDPESGWLGDLDLYEGFLKCLYTSGMVGGNAGYYAYPKGGFKAEFPADRPPHWLRQMVVLARVHALFSHQEHYLREGDLLAGPDKHVWNRDQPAYELPSGHEATRVLVRKLRERPDWLVTAWAADGTAREVEVTVPDLGRVKLRALPSAGVYRVTRARGEAQVESLEGRGG